MIGGLVLFDLARRMISRAGALVTLGYYLLLPFGATVSRTFQPDSLMVMGIILSAWAIYRWSESPTWRWAILAGL
jgi:4-amino-4-deoxy-L-arabinose transferase-like glycosyltransferase